MAYTHDAIDHHDTLMEEVIFLSSSSDLEDRESEIDGDLDWLHAAHDHEVDADNMDDEDDEESFGHWSLEDQHLDGMYEM